ncbi:hypothetical protein N7495_008365 [Penicillium taxi]|uniref:uncharacterized protein n=1 Tax=Penicillium taxi TaxID=168475 RepID=UPI0025455D84|nr:uncharacterized protein N7495_008365 [Penicillium taxi]KAJ5888324.1 hypothetical protein N7495_008365 [Penicillium taxi]
MPTNKELSACRLGHNFRTEWGKANAQKTSIQDFFDAVGKLLEAQRVSQVPPLAMSKLSTNEIIKAMGLSVNVTKSREFLDIPGVEIRPSRITSSKNRMDIQSAFGLSSKNEASVRSTLNHLLVLAEKIVSAKKIKNAQLINLRVEILWDYGPVTYDNQQFRLTGKPDYTIWYGVSEGAFTGIVRVEAKNILEAESEIGQCLGYGHGGEQTPCR